MRGGERVLDVIARAYPDADLYTLIHRPNVTTPAIEALRIRASPLNRLPGVGQHYRKLLPLYPWAARQLKIEGYDVVLSISHAVAKNARIEDGIPHISYCLTPMRYVWDQVDAYLGRGARRVLAAPLVAALRRQDVARSDTRQVGRFVAISSAVADRIQRHYGRSSKVIHPPVDVDRIQPNGQGPEDFYLLVGGFVQYKREDVAIEAFRMRSDRLVVVGDGPTRRSLEASAPPNVEFTGRLSDEELRTCFQTCRALIHPQEEDFGISAVEAQAAGRPVIAYGRGGARDTVRPLLTAHPGGELQWADDSGATGLYFSEQTPEALGAALDAFAKHSPLLDAHRIRANAERFSSERFVAELAAEIADASGRRSSSPGPDS